MSQLNTAAIVAAVIIGFFVLAPLLFMALR